MQLQLVSEVGHALPLVVDVSYGVALKSVEVGLLKKRRVPYFDAEVPFVSWKCGEK